MGKCVQCNEFLPPHFMVDVEKKEGETIDPKNPPQKCAYCHLDKKAGDSLTMVNDETGLEEKITKKEAVKRYKTFIKRLYQSKNIQDVLNQQIPTIKK